MEQKEKKTAKLIFLFLLSYVFLYFLQIFLPQFRKWEFVNLGQADYMYILMPIPAFFFMYYVIHWVDDFYNTKFAHSIGFPILFAVLSYAAFYIQYFWYWCNSYTIALGQLGEVASPVFYCSTDAARRVGEMLAQQLWSVFLDSAFAVFIVAGILGWASHIILEKFE